MLIPQLSKSHSDLIQKPKLELKDCLGIEVPDRKYYARIWSTGFELQSVTSGVEWDTTTGSPTIDTTTKRSGAASLRMNPSAASVRISHRVTASTERIAYGRVWLYIASLPAAVEDICGFQENVRLGGLGIRLNTNGTLELWDTGNGVQVGSDSSALSTGEWIK